MCEAHWRGGLQDALQSGNGLCPGLLLSPLRTLQVSDQGLGVAWGAVWDAVSGEGGGKLGEEGGSPGVPEPYLSAPMSVPPPSHPHSFLG